MSYPLNKTHRKKIYSHMKDLPAIVCVCRQAFINEVNKSDPQQDMGWHAALYLALGVMDCKCGLKHRSKNEQWKCQGKNTENRGILCDHSKTARKKGEPSLYGSDLEQCIMGLNEGVNTSWRLIFIHSLCVQWLSAYKGESSRFKIVKILIKSGGRRISILTSPHQGNPGIRFS